MSEKKFANKVALITGASRGIGKAVALLLAAQGATVIINYNKSTYEAESVQQFIRSGGGNAFIEQADVSNYESVRQMFDRISVYNPKIDILVNNAGMNDRNYIRYMKEEQWDHVVNTNMKSVFNCTKMSLKSMMKHKRGIIVNVSSIRAFSPGVQQAHYAAAKAGLAMFTKATAKEVGRFSIRVNGVAPGIIATNMDKMTQNEEEQTVELVPLRRIGEPREIANIVAFLCSDEASYITGEVIVADGGLTL